MSIRRISVFPKHAPFTDELVDHPDLSFTSERNFGADLDKLNKKLGISVVETGLILGQHVKIPSAEIAFSRFNMQRLDTLLSLHEQFSLRVRVPNGKTTRYARLILPNPF